MADPPTPFGNENFDKLLVVSGGTVFTLHDCTKVFRRHPHESDIINAIQLAVELCGNNGGLADFRRKHAIKVLRQGQTEVPVAAVEAPETDPRRIFELLLKPIESSVD